MKDIVQKHRQLPILLTGIIWISIILNQLLFGTNGVLNSVLSETGISKRWLIVTFIRFLLIAGQSTLFLAIGYYGPRVRQRFHQIAKSWLVIVAAGVLTTLGWMLFDQWSGSSVIWTVIFPILRNSYPLLTAALVGFLCVNVIDRFVERNLNRAIMMATGVILISTLFNQDIFGVRTNTTIISSLIFTFLGVVLKHGRLIKKSVLFHFSAMTVTVLVAGASLLLMIPVSSFSGLGMATMGRFVQADSVLTYLTTIFVFCLVVKLNGSNQSLGAIAKKLYPSLSLVLVSTVFTTNDKFNWVYSPRNGINCARFGAGTLGCVL